MADKNSDWLSEAGRTGTEPHSGRHSVLEWRTEDHHTPEKRIRGIQITVRIESDAMSIAHCAGCVGVVETCEVLLPQDKVRGLTVRERRAEAQYAKIDRIRNPK